jgi:hypothetical protein
MEVNMLCRWKPAPLFAVIVALLAAISVSSNPYEPLTIEEAAR